LFVIWGLVLGAWCVVSMVCCELLTKAGVLL
jgi:hypothetical protein